LPFFSFLIAFFGFLPESRCVELPVFPPADLAGRRKSWLFGIEQKGGGYDGMGLSSQHNRPTQTL